MDPAALLQPKDGDTPSGENLEYDPVFTEMELAAQPGEEQQMGDEIKAAEDPEYRIVLEKAEEILERSHDLRAAVFLSDALLRTEGLVGFADATTYIRGCLEEYWDTCHPELDADDDDDPTMRINAIQDLCGQPDGLGGPSPVYRSLRRAPITDSRGFGRFSLRDIDIAEGRAVAPEDMENIPDGASVAAAFQDTDEDTLNEVREAVARATEDMRAISAVFDDKTPGRGPELDPMIKALADIGKIIADKTGVAVDAAEDAAGADDVGAPDEGPAQSGGTVGAINSPADVSNALEKIIAYYRRSEPSSPIPILLERAKRLVNADFLTIMQDMAPLGVESVNVIGGLDET